MSAPATVTMTMDFHLFERMIAALESVEKLTKESRGPSVAPTLTPEEVAEILRVAPAFVRDLHKKGEIKGIRLNNKRLIFREEDVREYLEYKSLEGEFYR